TGAAAWRSRPLRRPRYESLVDHSTEDRVGQRPLGIGLSHRRVNRPRPAQIAKLDLRKCRPAAEQDWRNPGLGEFRFGDQGVACARRLGEVPRRKTVMEVHHGARTRRGVRGYEKATDVSIKTLVGDAGRSAVDLVFRRYELRDPLAP